LGGKQKSCKCDRAITSFDLYVTKEEKSHFLLIAGSLICSAAVDDDDHARKTSTPRPSPKVQHTTHTIQTNGKVCVYGTAAVFHHHRNFPSQFDIHRLAV
jgi:hypothetical protein